MFSTNAANAMTLKMAESISYNGSLDHQFSFNKIGGADPIITNISSIRLRAGTYFWRPWLATLDSNVAFSYTNRKNSNNSTGEDITGDATLQLFPQSHFPFSSFVSRRNSDIEGDLNSQELTTTSYGLSQRYVKNASSLSFRYEHTEDENVEFNFSDQSRTTEDIEDRIDLDLATRLGNHDISTRSTLNYIDRTREPQSEDQILHVVQHNYIPDTSLTMNNMFTYNDRTFTQNSGNETEQKIVQFNSNTFWRPKNNNSLLVTVNALAQGTGDFEDSKIGIFDNAGISAQVNYQKNPYLNLRAQGSIRDSEDNTQTEQRIGAEYSPADTELLSFRHTYNLSVDLANITEQIEDDRLEGQLRAGHIFSKNFPIKLGNINLSLTQRAASIVDTQDTLDRTLTHSIGLGWNHSATNSNSNARLTLSDTRRFSKSEDEFGLQQLNLQISRSQTLSRQASINSNITLQANRTLEDNNTGDDVDYNSSVSVNYTHNNMFGIQRLRLISEVRYLSNSIFELVNSDGFDDQDFNDTSWENRLYYDIGRLSLRLTTKVGQTNDASNALVFFQIRRNFGN